MEVAKDIPGSASRSYSSQGAGSTDPDESNSQYERKIREKILSASLPFVAQHGWSQQALAEGAKSLDYPGVTSGLFQNGPADLIFFFYNTCNSQLAMRLKGELTPHIQTDGKQPHEIVEAALEERLRMIIPYLERWPQALGIMTMPRNVPIALSNLLTMVDDICYHAGDRSVDFNWYSRRIAIGGIYKITELCMIQDKSPDYAQTWDFLHRRMEEAVQIHSLVQASGDVSTVARDALTATFTTARNILRLNGLR